MTTAEMLRLAAAIKCSSILTAGSWNTFRLLRDRLKGTAPSWCAWCGYDYPGKAAPDMWKEATYDGCLDVHLYFTTDSKVVVHVVMWDGDSVDGYRTYRRCEWKFEITDDHSQLIGEFIVPMLLREVKDRAAYDITEEAKAAYLAEVQRRTDAYITGAGVK